MRPIAPTAGCALTALLGLTGAANAQVVAQTDFESGAEGWYGLPSTAVQPGIGNPGAALRTPGWFNFWAHFTNETDADFLGDYGAKGPQLEFSFDFKVDALQDGFGRPVARPLLVEFIDYDLSDGFYPYASVYSILGIIEPADLGWQTFSIGFDPNSTVLPAGWGGTGGEDSSGNPQLPADVTFADVLAGIDAVSINTAEPGFNYLEAYWDLSIDNITLTSVPAPSGMVILLSAGSLAFRRRR